MSNNKQKARTAKRFLQSAEDFSKDAKKIFEEIGDPDGEKKAANVEREAREAKEYVSKRLGE